ncbi:hypothetical protein LguiA_023264 [Lonicera macranthoides]
MDPIPKRHCSEPSIEANNNSEDLISSLPDCVLSHILSKLPTKYAVATTILSTRWKDLFAAIPEPSLEFDDSLILNPGNNDDDEESNVEYRIASFAKFTYRVLNVIFEEVGFVSRFTLKLSEEYQDGQILDWIYAALQHAVPVIDLDICMDYPDLFFELINGWTCLRFITLRNYIGIYIPDSFTLPNLEYLVLDGIQFYTNDEISLLLSGCPVLQRLTMSYLRLEEVDTVNISVPSLKHLTIEYCWYTGEEEHYKVVLDTPALESLYYEDYMPDELVLKNLNSNIRAAHVSVLLVEELSEADSFQYHKDVAALIRACSSVRTLFLSKDTVSAFQKSSEPFPKFCNLTGLQLGGFDTNGWELLPQLLDNVPKLEILSIAKEFFEEKGCFDIFESHLSDKIAPCLLSNLKKIEIFEFKGELDELYLIEYFLYTGKVLNEFEIIGDMSWDKYVIIREILARLPRLSDTCEIFFRNFN